MSRNQRLTFLGLALVVLVAAVVVIRPGGDDDNATTASQPTATPRSADTGADATPTSTPTPTVDPGPLLVPGRVTRIDVNKGDRVRFRAKSPAADEIHVHGYDLSKAVEAGKIAQMSFVADIEGIFEIELEQAGEQIAELRVEP